MQNHSNYPTVCLLLDMAHRTDHCITVYGKWIFYYNLEFALPLTKASLDYICSGNDTDEIKMKHIIKVINWHQYQIHHYQHCSDESDIDAN